MQGGTDSQWSGPGGAGYSHAKRGGPVRARPRPAAGPAVDPVNSVHPTNCDTEMLQSEPMYRLFRPDLDHPRRDDVEAAFASMQAMPVPYVDPVDISNAVLFPASDESRYVTGLQMKVDAGATLARTSSGAP